MNYQDYITQIGKIQIKVLHYLDEENNVEENYQNLINLIKEQNYETNIHDLKLFLNLISNVVKYHFRSTNFIEKIEQIIISLKELILNHIKNIEIFNIFKDNKTILFILFKNCMIFIDKAIENQIMFFCPFQFKYDQFFSHEIQQFIDETKTNNNKICEINNLPEKFYDKRRIGENDEYICQLIREDSIENFIIYVNKNFYSLNSLIEVSAYETNPLLIKRLPSLIEYSAYFGSVQIFKYLFNHDVKLDQSIWMYSIHGNNPEIINFLIEKDILPEDPTYEECFRESIRCHNNEMANFIENNFLNKQNTQFDDDVCSTSFEYHNYLYISNHLDIHIIFYYACKHEYYTLVKLLIKTKKIDINNNLIFKYLFLNRILKYI